MASGLGVRVFNTAENTSADYSFDRLPVRIGRNPLNDLQLDFPFVSQFHAVLELHGTSLVLRDLGSTNGTTVRGGARVPQGQVVNLADTSFEFGIVSLYFRTFTAEIQDGVRRPKQEGRGGLSCTSMVLQAIRPGQAPAGRIEDLLTRHAGLYSEYRTAWSRFAQSMNATLAELDPPSRANFLQRIGSDFAGVAAEADFRTLAAQCGVSIAGSQTGMNPEAWALRALRELAANFLPQLGAPESVQELAGFVDRLHSALNVFLRSFVPLRDGYKQFEKEMGVRRIDRPSTLGDRLSVTTARDSKELASLLLDWRVGNSESCAIIESTFADIMIHQVAILNGVMTGARKLLLELAPHAVDKALAEGKIRAAALFRAGPFRYRALWKAYEERYGDVAEERFMFDYLFGPVFARIAESTRPDRPVDDPQHMGRAPSNWPSKDS